MEYQPPSDTHRGGGISFRALDTLLGEASQHEREPVDISTWLVEARRAGEALSSEKVLTDAIRLLNDFPYQHLASLLQPEGEAYDMAAIRKHRRALLVARDAIILTTDMHTTVEFNELRFLCRTIGQFADTHASQSYLADMIYASTLELAASDRQAYDYIHNDGTLHAKFDKYLDEIGILKLHKPVDNPLDLHERRKHFRRSVDVLALEACDETVAFDRTIALEGLRINTAFGHVSDRARATSDDAVASS